MQAREEDNDSDAPEEFTSEQGIQRDSELRKVEREEKARVVREGKERRRQWAQKKTQKSKTKVKDAEAEAEAEISYETEPNQGNVASRGMLPDDIVQLLAAREKQVFASDSEDEKEEQTVKISKKKRHMSSGPKPVILKEIPSPPCVESSMEFLKKRKLQVSRSSSVLNNSSQALRLLSGLLSNR